MHARMHARAHMHTKVTSRGDSDGTPMRRILSEWHLTKPAALVVIVSDGAAVHSSCGGPLRVQCGATCAGYRPLRGL